MGRHNILFSDDNPQDLEDYPHDSKDGLKSSTHSTSVTSHSAGSASPIKLVTKWALICTLLVLAMTFTSELFGSQSSKASRSIGKTMLVAH